MNRQTANMSSFPFHSGNILEMDDEENEGRKKQLPRN
jgi:hypothetical protein